MPREYTLAGEIARDQIYNYISDFTRNHNIPPTMRQIGKGLKITSTSVVWYHIRHLKEQGRVYSVGDGKSIRYMPSNARIVFDENR